MKRDVPQGSILGPLFYLIRVYINLFPKNLPLYRECLVHSDEPALINPYIKIDDLQNKLTNFINQAQFYFLENVNLKINRSKTAIVYFNCNSLNVH